MAELADTLRPSTDDRLDQAEALVRSYCGWHIAPSRAATITRTPVAGWLRGRSRIFLPSLHVTAVTVTLDDVTQVAEGEYTWASPDSFISDIAGWSDSLALTFTHGYTDVPAEVAGVVQSIAQRAVNNPGSLVRTQAGPFADTYSQTGFNQSLPLALLDAEKDILRPYRLIAVA